MITSSSEKKQRGRHKKWPFILFFAALAVIACVYLAAADIRNVKMEVTAEAGTEISADLFFHKPSDSAQILTDLSGIRSDMPGEYTVSVQTRFTVVESRLRICDTAAPAAQAQPLQTFLGRLPEPEEYLTGVQDATAVEISYSRTPAVNEPGQQTGELLLTDAAGNQTAIDIVLTVIDDKTAPVIEGAEDLTVFLGDPVDYASSVRAVDDHDPAPSLVIDDGEYNPDAAGEYTILYIATDASGNTSTAEARVHVVSDTTAPVISGITNISIFVGETADYVSAVEVSDDYDPDPLFVIDDGEFDPDTAGVYTIIYTATDFSGNAAVRTAAVTVIDDVFAPIIEGADDYVLLVGEGADLTANVRVSDDYDENPTLVVDEGGFDPDTPGVYTVTYTATDFSGNVGQATSEYTVMTDTVAPTIAGVCDHTIWRGEECDYTGNVHVYDALDDAPVLTVDDSGVDLSAPGIYTVVYTAVDASGNSVSASARITVLDDTEPPVISGVSDHTVYVGESVDYLAGLTVTDNSDPEPYWEIDDPGVDFSKPGEYIVRFAAVDKCENLSRAQIRIVVKNDTEKPVFSGIENYTVFLGDTVDYVTPVTATDDRDGAVEVQIDHGGIDFNKEGTYVITYGCVDSAGNVAKQKATVSVMRDRKGPVISGTQDIKVEMGGTVSYRKGVTVTDNHDPAPKLSIDNSAVNLNKIGKYKVTYTATDASGNVTTVTIRVEVTRKKLYEEDADVLWPLADEILDSILTDDMTDMEKGFKIYQWCRRNILYSGRSDKASWVMGAYDAFTLRSGDCWNYYAASKALLTRAGIPNIDVITDENEYRRHYWNLIDIGTGWYHFDSCPFEAGDDDFFMLTDAELDYWDRTHRGAHPYDSDLYPDRATVSVQHMLSYRNCTVKDQ